MLHKQTQTTSYRMTMLTLQQLSFGDDATAGDTQEAELENELEQENEAEINQAAVRRMFQLSRQSVIIQQLTSQM